MIEIGTRYNCMYFKFFWDELFVAYPPACSILGVPCASLG